MPELRHPHAVRDHQPPGRAADADPRDLNYPHWVASRPLALSVLVYLDDLNTGSGGTVFLPASHRMPEFPSHGLVARYETPVTAKRGSFVVFDSMVFHRAGINCSARIRRGINHVIGVPVLGQQIDIPAMLGSVPPDDPWLAGYLGYRWNPVPSVKEWRLRKLQGREKPVL